jgi:hypothetical protein
MSRIQLGRDLRYTDQAIPALLGMAEMLRGSGFPEDAAFRDWCAFMLHMAIKFELPDYGKLFDHDGFTRTEVELFRLPYRAIAAEYFCPEQTLGTRYATVPVRKRIALAVDLESCVDDEGNEFPPGAAVISIDCRDSGWGVNPYLVTVLYDSAFHLSAGEWKAKDPSGSEWRQLIEETGLKPSRTGWGLRLGVLPAGELGRRCRDEAPKLGMDWPATVLKDVGGEKDTILHLCAALQCSNVRMEKVVAPEALQEKRERKGRLPFYTYHVLVLPDESVNATSGNGSHESPRRHLRRGHIRRLHDPQRTVWVNACLVGNAERGLVDKDYHVEV